MNLRQKINEANESIEKFLEKEIVPSFKDKLDQLIQKQTDKFQSKVDEYQKRVDRNKEMGWDSSYDEKDLEKYTKARDAKIVDKIYRYLGGLIDVQNCKIDEIPVTGLDSKRLRKILKDINCEKGVLLYPKGDNQGYYSEKYTPFRAYGFELEEGKLDIWPLTKTSRWDRANGEPISDAEPTNTFMRDLNDGTVAKYTDKLFVAYGKSISTVRKEKGRETKPYWYRDPDERLTKKELQDKIDNGDLRTELKYSGYDKSGYYVDVDALKKRLQTYKQNKGSYTQDIEAVVKTYEDALNKYRELVSTWDPRNKYNKDYVDPSDLRKKISDASWYFKCLSDALQKNNGPEVADYLGNCKRYARDLEAFL